MYLNSFGALVGQYTADLEDGVLFPAEVGKQLADNKASSTGLQVGDFMYIFKNTAYNLLCLFSCWVHATCVFEHVVRRLL
jgi:hypothetical protein